MAKIKRIHRRLSIEELEPRVAPASYCAGWTDGEIIVQLVQPVSPQSGEFRLELDPVVSDLMRIYGLSSPRFIFGNTQGTELARQVIAFTLNPAVDESAVATLISERPEVAWATPNFWYEGDPREYTPGDPLYGSQYHHTLMRNDLAWDTTLGSPSVVVAVLDDGVDWTHADLMPNIWGNAREIPGNGIDDDGNGYIDDVRGWDFVDNDNNPAPIAADSHGTHVAGIVAAYIDNGIGVAGTAGRVTLMPIRFYTTQPGFSWNSALIARAFAYAADNGAHIINISYNLDPFVRDQIFIAGVRYAYERGVLIINSAGNSNELNPARQAFTEMLQVASVNSACVKSSYSNYGTGVDISAPGDNIISTLPGNAYGSMSGTSMAAPNAAGVAALIWSAHPDWTRDQVVAQLIATADATALYTANPAYIGLLGSGLTDSFKAVTEAPPPPRISAVLVDGRITLAANGSTTLGDEVHTLTVRLNGVLDPSRANLGANWELRSDGYDGIFGTADDNRISLIYVSPYRVGANEISFLVGGLSNERYQLRAISGGLTDPFGTPLDGDGDGIAGDDFTITFTMENERMFWRQISLNPPSAKGGGISNTPTPSRNATVAFQPIGTEGNLIVAWQENWGTTSSDIYVAMWNHTAGAWQGLGPSTTGGGISNTGRAITPSIVVGTDGYPVVAWADNTPGNYEIYVRRWNGTSWVELGTGSASTSGTGVVGGISANLGDSTRPSIALGTNGLPIVAWEDMTGSFTLGNPEIYLRYWDGSSWQQYGGSAAGGGISNNFGASITPVITNGTPGNIIWVIWSDNSGGNYEIYARAWTAGAWTGTYNISGNSGLSLNPSVAKTTAGYPVVAWQDNSTGFGTVNENWEIYYRPWTGSAWGSTVNISNTPGSVGSGLGISTTPSIMVGTDNNPIIVWSDTSTAGNPEIFCARYDSPTGLWIAMDFGATGGQGISRNLGESLRPRIVAGAHGNKFLVWEDDTNGNFEIYGRRFAGLPIVSSVRPTVNPLTRPTTLTVQVFGPLGGAPVDYDGTVSRVEIYLDVNRNGILEATPLPLGSTYSDLLIGNATATSWSVSRITSDLPVGTYTIFARAVDNDGQYGNATMAVSSITIVNALPTIARMDVAPSPVNRLSPLTLTAYGVNDPDGQVAGVLFYWDADGNGTLGIGIDPTIGWGTSSGTGWAWTGTVPATWPQGVNTFFARPYDSNGEFGSAGTVVAIVQNLPPVVGGLTGSPNPILHTDLLTLIANGVTDPDQWVRQVNFYWDANANGIFDSTDLFLGKGTPWLELGAGSASGGGISNYRGPASHPTVALDTNGNPIVTWSDAYSGNAEIYVLRWNGSSWVEMGAGSASGGGISNNAGASTDPVIVTDTNGNPIVAWSDTSGGNSEIYVLRWNGSSWVEMGAGSASGGGISNNAGASTDPVIVTDTNGNPIVAWSDTSGGNSEIYVLRWNGSSWVAMGTGSASGGGISSNSGASEHPFIAIAMDGSPYVVWDDDSSGNREIYLRHWNGSSWVQYGGSATGGGVSVNTSASMYSAVVVGTDGNPIVAWSDSGEIFVRRWNGISWVEMGAGSASGGGISNNDGSSERPVIARGSDGNPIIAWQDNSNGNYEIYVLRWDGSSWREMAIGSATGGGVSDNTGSSLYPAIAVGTSGRPIVVWQDNTGGSWEIYVRGLGTVGQWAWSGSALQFPLFDNTFFVVAIDSDGALSNPNTPASQTIVTVQNAPPAISAFTASPPSVGLTGVLTLTAIPTDPDGLVTLVEFYRDVDGNGALDIGIDQYLGADTSGAGGWTWSGPVTGFPIGVNTYLARAQDERGAWSAVASTTNEVGPWQQLYTNPEGSASGGGISKTPGNSNQPSVALGTDGYPYVSWTDYSDGDAEIYVRRWNGSSWVGLGGSDSGGGISINIGASLESVIAIGTDGNPIVAWADMSGGNWEIYVRRWTGTAWVEMGTGSATGGGISNNAGASQSPSIAIGVDGNPVIAWSDNSSGNYEIYLRRWNGASWVPLGGSASGGGISANAGNSISPTVMIGTDGNPIVAWADNSGGNYEIYLRHWNGANWVGMGGSHTGGGISNNTGDSFLPALARGVDGNPIVAWQDNSAGNMEIYVRVWSGTSWIEMGTGSATGGGISNTANPSVNVAIAIAADGNPLIVWEEQIGANGEIYLRRWDGSSWQETPTGSATGGGISQNSSNSTEPAVAAGSRPVVVWTDFFGGNTEIYLRRWDGMPIIGSLTVAPNPGVRPNPIILTANGVTSLDDTVTVVEFYRDLNGNGVLDVGTDELLGTAGSSAGGWWLTVPTTNIPMGFHIYFARVQDSGGEWSQAVSATGAFGPWVAYTWGAGLDSGSGGGVSNNAGASNEPALVARTDGNLFVAWADTSSGNSEIYVLQWNGASWIELGGSATGGGISANAGSSVDPAICLAPDGNPIVAWSDDSAGNSEIYLRRWNGSSWVELGGSATGGGVSANIGSSLHPSVAVWTDGNPIVGWADNSSGNYEIYVRRWDGSAWVSMGTNSATGGGISYNNGASLRPALAVPASGAAVVVWQDDSRGNSEIYVRRWNGTSWGEMGVNSASHGGISNNAGASVYPALVLSTDGNPFVAWADNTIGNYEIYVRQWTGAAWVEVGIGSARLGGISNNAGESQTPTIVLGTDGKPIVAWADRSTTATSGEIFVRRWDGLSWVELGKGSAESGGVSVNAGDSLAPCLALGADGNPVLAWSDTSGGDSDIYVRHWDGLPLVSCLTASGTTITRPGTLTLRAIGVADLDGAVSEVEFYRDANGNGIFDGTAGDILLGSDTNGTDGWTWVGSVSGFPLGENIFFARVKGNGGQWSSEVSAVVTVQNAAPVIAFLTDSPDWVMRPNILTLAATGVTDADGSITQVEFYRDSDGNRRLDIGIDELLGVAYSASSAGAWKWSGSTATFGTGTFAYFAIAKDNDGQYSAPVLTLNTVVPPVVINSGFSRSFTDADGDTITIAVSGGGSAEVILNGAAFTTITLSDMTSRSRVTITDDVSGPGTVKLGDILAVGQDIGAFTIKGGKACTISDTRLNIGGNISALSLQAATTNVSVVIGGSVGSAVFSKNIAQTSLSIQGDLGTMTASGTFTNSTLQVAGKTKSLKISGAVDGSTVRLSGEANTLSLLGGIINASVLDTVTVKSLAVTGGVSGAGTLLAVGGDVNDLRITGGLSGNASVNVTGQATKVIVTGPPSGLSIEAGSILTLGSLKSAMTITGLMTGDVDIVGSAAGSNIKINGSLTGNLLAEVFGNVTITGIFSGHIGDAGTLPGTGTLRVGVTGGFGVVTPADAFARYYGYTP